MLVTLKQAPALTVVGQYACVPANLSVPQLESVGLPTPDWVNTTEEARSHFPGGCDVRRGVWVCVDSKATTSAVWTMLTSITRILVRKNALHVDIMYDVNCNSIYFCSSYSQEVLCPEVLAVLYRDGTEMECFTIDSGSLSSQSVGLATTSLQSYLTESTLLCRLLISVPLYLPEGQPGVLLQE